MVLLDFISSRGRISFYQEKSNLPSSEGEGEQHIETYRPAPLACIPATQQRTATKDMIQ